MEILSAKTSEGRSIAASRLVMNTAAIGRAISSTLLGKHSIIGDYHPGRLTGGTPTSGRGAPGAAKARVKRKIKNKAARKARKGK